MFLLHILHFLLIPIVVLTTGIRRTFRVPTLVVKLVKCGKCRVLIAKLPQCLTQLTLKIIVLSGTRPVWQPVIILWILLLPTQS